MLKWLVVLAVLVTGGAIACQESDMPEEAKLAIERQEEASKKANEALDAAIDAL